MESIKFTLPGKEEIESNLVEGFSKFDCSALTVLNPNDFDASLLDLSNSSNDLFTFHKNKALVELESCRNETALMFLNQKSNIEKLTLLYGLLNEEESNLGNINVEIEQALKMENYGEAERLNSALKELQLSISIRMKDIDIIKNYLLKNQSKIKTKIKRQNIICNSRTTFFKDLKSSHFSKWEEMNETKNFWVKEHLEKTKRKRRELSRDRGHNTIDLEHCLADDVRLEGDFYRRTADVKEEIENLKKRKESIQVEIHEVFMKMAQLKNEKEHICQAIERKSKYLERADVETKKEKTITFQKKEDILVKQREISADLNKLDDIDRQADTMKDIFDRSHKDYNKFQALLQEAILKSEDESAKMYKYFQLLREIESQFSSLSHVSSKSSRLNELHQINKENEMNFAEGREILVALNHDLLVLQEKNETLVKQKENTLRLKEYAVHAKKYKEANQLSQKLQEEIKEDENIKYKLKSIEQEVLKISEDLSQREIEKNKSLLNVSLAYNEEVLNHLEIINTAQDRLQELNSRATDFTDLSELIVAEIDRLEILKTRLELQIQLVSKTLPHPPSLLEGSSCSLSLSTSPRNQSSLQSDAFENDDQSDHESNHECEHENESVKEKEHDLNENNTKKETGNGLENEDDSTNVDNDKNDNNGVEKELNLSSSESLLNDDANSEMKYSSQLKGLLDDSLLPNENDPLFDS